MITANMHEAKTKLSSLIKMVEEQDEIIVICRNGKEVAEIIRRRPTEPKPIPRLTPNPALQVSFAPGYDPTEPATEEDWPSDCR